MNSKKLLLLTLLCCPILQTFAHDHLNLEHGVPLEVEDAYTTAYMNREFHTYFIYEDLPDDEDRYLLVPRLELGLFRNFQAEVATPFEFGDVENETSGNIELASLYNFNMETIWVPGTSLGGGVTLPTGEGREGYDTFLKLNLTKTLPVPISFHRLHANIYWTQNAQPEKSERINAMKYVIAHQVRVGTDDFFIVDYFYEEHLEDKNKTQMVELGWRHQYNPLTVLAAGIGSGLTDESPDFRINLSFQRALNLFY
ncbi:MAG: hypothetical protein ACLGHN_02045 [Bacteriovoracia bacterium]